METTRILLIDDDQVDRALVRRALSMSELTFDLTEATDGGDGLAKSEERRFDCVLLDYRLPDIDAFEMLSGLLGSVNGNNTVLILTGETDPELPARLIRAGALDYLAKADVTPSSLVRSIRYARARRVFLSELEQARSLAEEKTRELEVLNNQKDLLFSIIAHDLRNPFQALLGLSELAERAAVRQDTSALVRYAGGIHQSAARASALMESLFAWASLQLTKTQAGITEIDLARAVADTIANVADAAQEKKLELRSDCDGVRLVSDEGTVAAILRNLVNNAVKFTRPGGTIAVSARLAADNVVVAVSDTGVGIPTETLKTLFRIDRRTTTPGTRGEPGSGLGLLICRSLVDRLGGVLSVTSEIGVGTTFQFTVPTRQLPTKAAAAG